jgi:hypothetical protein
MQYFEEAREIWQNFVPKSGQADTVQGELLRAVEKLRDEARRNGNLNWSNGFKILLTYLEVHLTDARVFDPGTILRTKQILARLRKFKDPYTEEDYYDELEDRVVDYYKFHGSIPHTENPELHL